MGRRREDLDVSSSEDRGIPKTNEPDYKGSAHSSREGKRCSDLKMRKKSKRRKLARKPCQSDNFAYLDEVLTSDSATPSNIDVKEQVSPWREQKKPKTEKELKTEKEPKKFPSPHKKKYVSLLDDEMVIEGLSGESSTRRSPQSTTTEGTSEGTTTACTCTCKCKDCRQVQEKNASAKPKTEESDVDEEQSSELLTRVDKKQISPVCPVDPADGEGVRVESSSKILEQFYSPSLLHLEGVLSSMKTGDFRLCPMEGDVPFSKLRRHRQKQKFVIYYKTFQGRYRRYSITEAFVGQEVYYFVDCIDTEAPLFSCLYKLLKYYVDNRTYYSLQVQGFVRFPVGQVIKRGRFERHYADLSRK